MATLDGVTISFPLSLVDKFLTCPMCQGYFYEARTIAECLHTFCKDCIIKHISDVGDCPICHRRINTTKELRDDHLVQSLLSKIHPDLEVREMQLQSEFCALRGLDHATMISNTRAPPRRRQSAAAAISRVAPPGQALQVTLQPLLPKFDILAFLPF
eukprot:TRINITY_DN569_c0_g1_i2.p2 TRINITY_DN569_c0_g1~~TRINITY_DN569_c0_g1_i2.p2  ORF type:complete len:157 (-),score=30.86 TRINITY_DN569_c0_g1_i2:301-771(-)